MNFKFEEGKCGSSSILKFIDKDSFHSCRGFKNTNTGAAEPGGKGGQLPTQLLDPDVLSHATSFLTLFSACPPNFKLLPRPLFHNTIKMRFLKIGTKVK